MLWPVCQHTRLLLLGLLGCEAVQGVGAVLRGWIKGPQMPVTWPLGSEFYADPILAGATCPQALLQLGGQQHKYGVCMAGSRAGCCDVAGTKCMEPSACFGLAGIAAGVACPGKHAHTVIANAHRGGRWGVYI